MAAKDQNSQTVNMHIFPTLTEELMSISVEQGVNKIKIHKWFHGSGNRIVAQRTSKGDHTGTRTGLTPSEKQQMLKI